MPFCGKCGAGLVEGNLFCGKCGVKANVSADAAHPANKLDGFCPNCGYKKAEEGIYCHKCGVRLEHQTAMPAGEKVGNLRSQKLIKGVNKAAWLLVSFVGVVITISGYSLYSAANTVINRGESAWGLGWLFSNVSPGAAQGYQAAGVGAMIVGAIAIIGGLVGALK